MGPLVGWGYWLCSMVKWGHYVAFAITSDWVGSYCVTIRVVLLLRYTIDQGCRLCSSITPSQVGHHVVFLNQMLLLARFCVQVGPQAVLHSQTGSQAVLLLIQGYRLCPKVGRVHRLGL